MTTAAATRWAMKGTGYEYCNCDFGCGCNFGGFPNSKDGSCRALVGFSIDGGSCGDVDLSGVKAAAVIAWPKAIHEGNGQAAFIVDPATTDQQVDVLAQIFTGKLGGLPWELLGPTFEVVGLEKAAITIEGSGPKTTFRVEGIGEGRGDVFKTRSRATITSPRCTSRTDSSGPRANVGRGPITPPSQAWRSPRTRRTGSCIGSIGRTRPDRPSGRVIKRQNQHGWWRRQVHQTPGSASRARG